jgi:hypothetical protein
MTRTQLVQRHRNRDWSQNSLNNNGLWSGPAFGGGRQAGRTANRSAPTSIAISSVGIDIHRRRPNLALVGSMGVARTNIVSAAFKARRGNVPDLSGSPGIQARLLWFVML